MNDVIGPMILGVFISVLGITNMKGNIATLHWYHRRRVSEEDRLPFGKLVGLGTLIMGISIMLYGGFVLLADMLQEDLYTIVGAAIVVAGLIAGLALSFYAMMKYNKGIF